MSKRRLSRSRQRLFAAIEPLEARQLLSASIDHGLLKVRGTRGDDVITVDLASTAAGQVIDVSVNGVNSTFAPSAVSGIRVHGGRGKDSIILSDALPPATLRGGAGDDTLTGASGDKVVGGRGGDVINGSAGHDTINAGAGHNTLEQIVSTDTVLQRAMPTSAPAAALAHSALAAVSPSYTVTSGPVQINDEVATKYTITLASGVSPSSPVTVNVQGNGDFDFSSAANVTATSLTLSSSAPSASFYFIGTTPGTTTSLYFTNNGGLTDPVPYSVFVNDLRDTNGYPIYQTIADGNWSSPSTWEGGLVPGLTAATQNADVLIYNNVTLDKNATLGTGPYIQNCLEIAIGHSLTVNSGITLTLRGDAVQFGTVGTTSNVSAVFNAGSSLVFDSSQLLNPAQNLTWDVGAGYDPDHTVLALNGTVTQPVKVSSVAAGGAGYFSASNDGAGRVQATYTHFLRIGDATHLAFNPVYNYTHGTFSLTNSTFDTCGEISPVAANNSPGNINQGDGSYIINNCIFVNSQGPASVRFSAGTSQTTATWSVSNDNSDKPFNFVNTTGLTATGDTVGNVTGYTLTGPANGSLKAGNTFTVSLIGTGTLPAGIKITPHIVSGKGTLSAAVTLTNSVRSATFTYYPASNSGPTVIGTTDSATNLVDPQPLVFTPNANGVVLAQYPSTATVNCISSRFKVSLSPAGDYSPGVTLTPTDNGAGGSFNPTSFVLSTASPDGYFTYTPASTGTKTITITNSAGWANLTDTVKVAATTGRPSKFSVTGPANGVIEAASTSFTVALGSGSVTGVDVFTPSVSDGDGYFTPASVSLNNAIRTATFTYTPITYGIRTITVNDNVGLTAQSVKFVGEVQTGASGTGPTGVRVPDTTGFNFFANGYLTAFAPNVQAEAADVNSASIINSFHNLGTTVTVQDWTDTAEGSNALYGYPVNIVPQNQPLVPVQLGGYGGDPGPAPIPSNTSVEGYYSATIPEPTSDANGDQHAFVEVRNDATGGVSDDWEMYEAQQMGEGGEWNPSEMSHFNIATGAQRPDGEGSTARSGTPIAPLLLNYSEVAQAEAAGNHQGVGHMLSFSMPNAYIVNNAYVFPSKSGAYIGAASQTTGLDYGAVIRLSTSWYDANAANFTGQARVLVDTLYHSGMMLTDGSSGNYFQIRSTSDERWDTGNLGTVNGLSATAFEVVNEQPILTITGPSSGKVGQQYAFTWTRTTYTPPLLNSSNFVYNSVSAGSGNGQWSSDGFSVTDSAQTGTIYLTPTSAGTMTLSFQSDLQWLLSAPTTFTAS